VGRHRPDYRRDHRRGVGVEAGTTEEDTPKAEVPEVLDGRKIRRIYGTVWIDDPIVLAFKQVGTIPIKAKGK
jgi:hypothetical protein